MADPAVRILAIDPGKATGLALWRDENAQADDAAAFGELAPEWQAWMLPWQESMDSVITWCESGQLAHVVCENFVISARTVTQGKDAHWPIGGRMVAQYTCARLGIPFSMQMPSDAKSFVTNDKLRRLGWKTPGKDHPDDATRHLVLYLARTGAIDPARLVVQSL